MQFKILCVNGSVGKCSVFKTKISWKEGEKPKNTISNESFPELLSELQGHCLVKKDNLVYCIGGECHKTFTNKNDVFSLDLSEKNKEDWKWEPKNTMNEGRGYFGAALYDGKLVVNGGQKEDKGLNTTEQFDENNDYWNKLGKITNVPRAYHALVAAEPASGTDQDWSLFAIGGLTTREAKSNSGKANANSPSAISTKSVERLGKLDGQWEEKEDMNIARGRFAAVFCAGFIYAIGGASEEARKTVEKYDISKNTWTAVESMNIGRYDHAACVVKDKIFVFGGKNNDGKIEKTIEFYDPERNKWMICDGDELKHECISHAVVGL